MNKLFRNGINGLAVLALGLPLAALASPVAKQERYWSVHGGINNVSSWPATVDFGGPQVNARLDLDRGLHLGLAIGHRRERARYELEFQHGRFDIQRATVAAISEAVQADGSYDVLTANALREARLNPDFSLFGGLGLGVGRVKLPHISLNNGCKCLGPADKTGFTWQARVGADHRVSESGRGFLQLGWLGLPKPEGKSISYRKKGTAVLSLGYRHAF